MFNFSFDNIDKSSWDIKHFIFILLLIPFYYISIFLCIREFFNENHFSIILLLAYCLSIFNSYPIFMMFYSLEEAHHIEVKKPSKKFKFKLNRFLVLTIYVIHFVIITVYSVSFYFAIEFLNKDKPFNNLYFAFLILIFVLIPFIGSTVLNRTKKRLLKKKLESKK